MKRFAVAASILALLGAFGVSRAAVQTVVALPAAALTGTFDGMSLAQKSQPLTFLNLDVAVHNVVSIAIGPDTEPWCSTYGPGACPLFASAYTTRGQTSTADLSNVVVGETYDFVCWLHPNMRGQVRII